MLQRLQNAGQGHQQKTTKIRQKLALQLSSVRRESIKKFFQFPVEGTDEGRIGENLLEKECSDTVHNILLDGKHLDLIRRKCGDSVFGSHCYVIQVAQVREGKKHVPAVALFGAGNSRNGILR